MEESHLILISLSYFLSYERKVYQLKLKHIEHKTELNNYTLTSNAIFLLYILSSSIRWVARNGRRLSGMDKMKFRLELMSDKRG